MSMWTGDGRKRSASQRRVPTVFKREALHLKRKGYSMDDISWKLGFEVSRYTIHSWIREAEQDERKELSDRLRAFHSAEGSRRGEIASELVEMLEASGV